MAAAVIADLAVAPEVIDISNEPRAFMRQGHRSLGHRLLGVTALFGLVTLMLLLAHAFLYLKINAGHVELDRLNNVIAQEQESVRELHIELRSRRAPTEIERLATGALGMVPAKSATQIEVRPEHLESSTQLETVAIRRRSNSDWLSIDQLLTEALAVAASNSGR
ncbi:MAG: hypothetical protein VX635_00105 [Actinomycetota bacterium]|jgi:hypothetical protein|nr:hypothetical protein [Acidimicrobiales bacterium]MEC8923667.1 hypothetical protein [Actinomycetota bacterium]